MAWFRKEKPDPGLGRSEPDEEVARELERAHRLGDEGDWEGMATLLREALDSHPGDAFVLCWLGVAERELGMDGVAYERFKACLARQPRDPRVLTTAGNAIAAFDDPDAEAALRAGAMLGPDVALTRWMYGAYLSREGFYEEALKELQAARELEPENATITYELAVALALSGNDEGAVDELLRASELDREDGWIRVVLGLALLEQERLEEALSELAPAARARPEDVEAQLLAALAAAALGSSDLAWEMLERARMRGEGADLALTTQAEDRLDDPEAALDLLMTEVAPGALRERLMTRP